MSTIIATPPTGVRNIQAETLIEEMGLEYVLELVPLSSINRDKSLKNQARFEPLRPDHVEAIYRAWKSGAVLPATICGILPDEDDLITADGNHRLEAGRRLEEERVWVYVVQCPSLEDFQSLSYVSNARLNGMSNTLEEKTAHAASLVDKGTSKKDAAILFGIPENTIQTYRSARVVRERFHELGISDKTYGSIPDASLVSLSGAAQDTAVRESLRLFSRGVTAATIVKLLRDAALTRSSDSGKGEAQVEALKEMHEQLGKTTAKAATSAGRRTSQSKSNMLSVRLLGAESAVLEARGLSPEYDDLLQKVRDALDAT